MIAAILFPIGVRLSTWLVLAALLALGSRDRWWRGPLLAATWFFGTEVAFDATAYVVGTQGFWPKGWFLAPLFAGLAAVLGCRVDLRFAALTLWVWLIWVAAGFHYNGHSMVGFNPWWEALNEGAKTAWGLAYLVPLFRDRVSLEPRCGRLSPSRSRASSSSSTF